MSTTTCMSNTQIGLLLTLFLSITVIRGSYYSVDGINDCQEYHECLVDAKRTPTNNVTPTNTLNKTPSNEREPEQVNSSTFINCFDKNFCICTENHTLCQLDYGDWVTLDIVSHLVFWVALFTLLCMGCRGRVDLTDASWERFKVRLVLFLGCYLLFVIVNVFLSAIVNRALYDRNGFKIAFTGPDFVWFIFAISVPIYLFCYLKTSSPIVRYFMISRIKSSLKEVHPNELPNEECSICLTHFHRSQASLSEEHSNSPVIKTVCNHYFHYDCLRPHLILHNSCPMCRRTLYHTETEPTDREGEANHSYQSVNLLTRGQLAEV